MTATSNARWKSGRYTTLKETIIGAYTQARLAVTNRGMRGEEAKAATRAEVVRVLSRETGKVITEALVPKAVSVS